MCTNDRLNQLFGCVLFTRKCYQALFARGVIQDESTEIKMAHMKILCSIAEDTFHQFANDNDIDVSVGKGFDHD